MSIIIFDDYREDKMGVKVRGLHFLVQNLYPETIYKLGHAYKSPVSNLFTISSKNMAMFNWSPCS